jgi:hypothetical protein
VVAIREQFLAETQNPWQYLVAVGSQSLHSCAQQRGMTNLIVGRRKALKGLIATEELQSFSSHAASKIAGW